MFVSFVACCFLLNSGAPGACFVLHHGATLREATLRECEDKKRLHWQAFPHAQRA
jgi:hypothetical protein